MGGLCSRSMPELPLRVVTALLLAGVVLAAVAWAPLWGLALAAAVAAGVGMWEYTRLALGPRLTPGDWAGVVLAGGLAACGLAGGAALAALLPLALLVSSLASLWSGQGLALAWTRLARRGFGLVYVGGLLACLVVVASLEQGRALVVYLLLVVAAADIGAYFTGHAIGRHKLAPRLSPGKTLEGLAGGLLAALLVSVVVDLVWLGRFGLAGAALMGVVLALVSVAGDLLESALKRSVGAKDASCILPGHGGFLDRVDGLLPAVGALLAGLSLWV